MILYYRRFDIRQVASDIAINEISQCRDLNQRPVIVSEVAEPHIQSTKQDDEVYSISKSRDPFSKNK